MISKDEYSKTTELMSQAIDAFSEQISVIRAGRANPSVLKNIYVDYYGQKTPLLQIGNISSPEPRLCYTALGYKYYERHRESNYGFGFGYQSAK